MIRETYRQLYKLLLWGHALHVFFHRLESSDFYTEYAGRLQRELRLKNAEGLADAVSDHVAKSYEVCKELFVQLGIEQERLT